MRLAIHVDVAQLVARNLAKVKVAGSIPVIHSQSRHLSSVWYERPSEKRKVGGSTPPGATAVTAETLPAAWEANWRASVRVAEKLVCKIP